MNCRHIQANLLADIKEEIASVTHKEIEGHLVQCETCQNLRREIVCHLEVYAHLSICPPSPHGWLKLSDKIRRLNMSRENPSPARSWHAAYFGGLALIALVILFGVAYSFSREAEWNVHVLQGKLRVGADRLLVSETDLFLRKGMTLNTGDGETARCNLRSGISIALGADTIVELDVSPRLILRQGEIYVQSKAGEKLIVQTEAGEIHIRGTVFSVSCFHSLTTLTVYEGSVCFRNQSGIVVANEGQTLKTRAGSTPEFVESSLPEDYPWWAESPVSLALEASSQEPHSLFLHLRNMRSHPITLAPFSGGSPRFCIHIKNQDKSYTIPLPAVLVAPPRTPLVIPPSGSYTLQCNLSGEMQQKGDYCFVAVYHGDGENGWKGIAASPPLKVYDRLVKPQEAGK